MKVHLPEGRRSQPGLRQPHVLGDPRRDRDRRSRRDRLGRREGHLPVPLALLLGFGQPLVQAGADVIGGVGIAAPLIARDQRATGDDTGDAGHSNPLPDAVHARQCA